MSLSLADINSYINRVIWKSLKPHEMGKNMQRSIEMRFHSAHRIIDRISKRFLKKVRYKVNYSKKELIRFREGSSYSQRFSHYLFYIKIIEVRLARELDMNYLIQGFDTNFTRHNVDDLSKLLCEIPFTEQTVRHSFQMAVKQTIHDYIEVLRMNSYVFYSSTS